MSDRLFVKNITRLDRQRSVFPRNFNRSMSLEFGKLNVIGWDEILPGDTFSTDLASVVRMQTPVGPFFGNLFMDVYAFFVPNRLIWDHWKEFQGESNTAWIQSNTYTVPQVRFYDNSANLNQNKNLTKNIFTQFGLPLAHINKILKTNSINVSGTDKYFEVSALPFRAYQRVWNDFFRDVNNMDANLYWLTNDSDITVQLSYLYDGTIESSSAASANLGRLLPTSKFYDLFTGCLRAPQRGPAVALPMSASEVPLVTGTAYAIEDPAFYSSTGGNTAQMLGRMSASADYAMSEYQSQDVSNPGSAVDRTNLYADLSAATSATVNELRIAFATQRYFEALARSGNRYRDMLHGIFGVTSSDARLQYAEYLGGQRYTINVDQVISHAETLNSSNALVGAVGDTGAYSLTINKSSLMTKTFEEHGILLYVATIREKETYTQGIDKLFLRKNKLDYYVPQFANIGEVPVSKRELFAAAFDSNNAFEGDGVFGYQEAWYEYRYRPDTVVGALDPNNYNSLSYMTLGTVFSGTPVLNKEFISANGSQLQRVLTAGSDGVTPWFIADFHFKQKVAREMPLYSIPGLIDHH